MPGGRRAHAAEGALRTALRESSSSEFSRRKFVYRSSKPLCTGASFVARACLFCLFVFARAVAERGGRPALFLSRCLCVV